MLGENIAAETGHAREEFKLLIRWKWTTHHQNRQQPYTNGDHAENCDKHGHNGDVDAHRAQPVLKCTAAEQLHAVQVSLVDDTRHHQANQSHQVTARNRLGVLVWHSFLRRAGVGRSPPRRTNAVRLQRFEGVGIKLPTVPSLTEAYHVTSLSVFCLMART